MNTPKTHQTAGRSACRMPVKRNGSITNNRKFTDMAICYVLITLRVAKYIRSK